MKARLLRVFAELQPGRKRGAVAWFIRQLKAHGVKVSPAATYRYVNGEREAPETVWGVLGVLEADARFSLEEKLKQLNGGA